jgi:hypothetical protein
MAIYVVYDRTTGKIVHTHAQPDELPLTDERVLALVDRGLRKAKLGTLVVNPSQIKLESLYRVDPKTKELQPTDEKGAAGFGFGAATNVSNGWPTSGFKISYAPGRGSKASEG